MTLSTKINKAATSEWAAKCHAFIRCILTPLGFCITIYGLNVIAWGGMLFLLLCNATLAMCHPNCDSENSPRQIWIKINPQIPNASILRHWIWTCPLAHPRSLPLLLLDSDSTSLLPTTSASDSVESPTNSRAPTPLWKVVTVVWGNMLNTVFQVCLAVYIWAVNRFNRPSWTTGLFVALACLAARAAGIDMWLQKKRIHKSSENPGALLLVPQMKQPTAPDALDGHSMNSDSGLQHETKPLEQQVPVE
ncbi:hypothetical protein BDV12DRAFT_190445 [Aspergillus spectabilis]